ncbi:MAG: response regulator transcription factor [Alicyclobacillaceae bacterium]|nr:response regulator transcription factor [Alicyclobacillaceae bacterium]
MNCHEEKIRVAMVDDHPVVREGLRAFLQLASDIEIVHEFEDGETAVRMLQDSQLSVDVVIMDLKMPGPCDGIAAIRQLHALRPALRLLALTSFSDSEAAIAALSAGAIGYLQKDVPPDLLLGSIRQAAAGRMVMEQSAWAAANAINEVSPAVPPTQTADVMSSSDKQDQPAITTLADPLTERERDVLEELARGLSNKEIGINLGISEKTVKVHVSHILGKLNVFDRTQAVLYAVKLGLVKL